MAKNKIIDQSNHLFERYWEAFISRDKRFDGVFFTGVTTTAIFCKPSCPARKPKRENVVFYDSIEDAESDGFRACLRCKPTLYSEIDPSILAVFEAARLLQSEPDLALHDLGSMVKISSEALRRMFSEIFGISPKKYAEYVRIKKFRVNVTSGSSVVNAMYDSGYGSSRALYENVADKFGMTPKVYQQKGKGVKISYTITDSELGRMIVGRTEKGICDVAFGESDDELLTNLQKEFKNAEITEDQSGLKEAVLAINDHLCGKTKILELPLDLRASAFQAKVWDALRMIPFGETVSYKQVAEKLGIPKSVRAVARAIATNNVAVVIPCHRVIGSDGSLTGYRWGLERKVKLLNMEKL